MQASDDSGHRGVRSFINHHRTTLTRFMGIGILGLALVTQHKWPEDSWLDRVFELLGYLMVMLCTMGRVWCGIYIRGYKTKNLITQGPYSLSRNPLYFFSLIGGVGVGFATETFLIPGIIILAFALYYPVVIRNEERGLRRLYGKEFEDYAARVPPFFPRPGSLRSYQEPEKYLVNTRVLRRDLLSVWWFVTFFLLLHVFESLRDAGVVPVLFRTY